MAISIKLTAFEGPLDLLLHLIDKNKVNIYDIPIVEITEQYMDYVNDLKGEKLDLLSEFLVMAATLLDIKSKMLLPKVVKEDGQIEDPREELVAKLLEYKMYKYMSYELKDRQIEASRILFRKQEIPEEVSKYEQPVDLDKLLNGITLDKLREVFDFVIKKQKDKIDPLRSKFGQIEKEEVNLEDKISYVLEYARNERRFSFRKLLEVQKSKMHIIVTFLAILELMKTGTLSIIQENIFGDILVETSI